MSMPKADDGAREWFRSLVPDGSNVTVRPMFGNLAAFVNANMFLALFGPRVAVRLSEPDRAALLATKGAEPFEPMPGRPMAEYVTLPEAWRKQPKHARAWVERSFVYASGLPPRKK